MVIPIGDQPNPRGTPWVNYSLIAINAAVFVLISLPLMTQGPNLNDPETVAFLRTFLAKHPGIDPRAISAYDLFINEWGYLASAPSLITLGTSMFLHGGWMHLLGNMLFLWIYGDNVEARLGPLGYLVSYLVSGIAAGLYGTFVSLSGAGGGVPMVGASGAISGVLGFYFLWFPRNKVRLLVLLFPFLMDVFLVPARLVLGFFLVVENLLPFFLQPQGGGGVAYGAHIGGFLAGLGGGYFVNHVARWRSDQRVAQKAASRPNRDVRRGSDESVVLLGAERVMQAMSRGEVDDALRIYLSLTPAERLGVPVSTVVQIGDTLGEEGEGDAALAVYRRGLADHPRGPLLDRLYLGIGLTLLIHRHRPTAAYQFLMDALESDPSPGVERAARQGLEEIARQQKLPFNRRN